MLNTYNVFLFQSIPWTLRSYYNAPMIKITRSGPAGFLIILSSAESCALPALWQCSRGAIAAVQAECSSVAVHPERQLLKTARELCRSRPQKTDRPFNFVPQNHPDVANKLATCPFNARHQVPRAEISHHISSCDDKSCIEQDVVNQTRNLGQETLAESTWQCPPCDEDWDKDLWEQTSTPFVWGTANYCGNNSPANNIVMEHKSNLASGMRVPKSLPYVLPWKNSE
ncbi:Gametocyte-specific factor 1 [Galemys pyrenaicus]|uniref:Gametocyte-specific factor 1 n=1 Tax=Galemys pyrenaicus TaxID=202257 RepID=A0A8J6AB16_GALPY|nr:Gametocyte-specific factor 1 [Galemys pyrenaicus]